MELKIPKYLGFILFMILLSRLIMLYISKYVNSKISYYMQLYNFKDFSCVTVSMLYSNNKQNFSQLWPQSYIHDVY